MRKKRVSMIRGCRVTFIAAVLAMIAGCVSSTTHVAAEVKPTHSLLNNREIDEAFAAGLQLIDTERKWNNATEFTCTHRFPAFARLEEVGGLVAYFQSRGVPARVVDQNQQHFVWFEIKYKQLQSWSYRGFRSGDVIRLVFTTENANSDKVTSFNARLFGRDLP
jgi:hypothetical protein